MQASIQVATGCPCFCALTKMYANQHTRCCAPTRVLHGLSGVDPPPQCLTRPHCVHFAQHLLGLELSLDALQMDPSPLRLVSWPSQLPTRYAVLLLSR